MCVCATEDHSLAPLTLPSHISQKRSRHQHSLAFLHFFTSSCIRAEKVTVPTHFTTLSGTSSLQSFSALSSVREALSLVNRNERAAAGHGTTRRHENPADTDIIKRAGFSFRMNKVGRFEGQERRRSLCDRLGCNEPASLSSCLISSCGYIYTR